MKKKYLAKKTKSRSQRFICFESFIYSICWILIFVTRRKSYRIEFGLSDLIFKWCIWSILRGTLNLIPISSSEDGMFWICVVDAALQLRLLVLQKDATFLNQLLIVKQAKVTVCILCSR